jgi:WD repeat-containing protein 19
VLDIEMAVSVYRQLGDAGMVLGLEPLLAMEDPRLLAGHAALLFGRYDEAERLFLASSRPAAAMEMRRDLLQCDRALQFAQLVAPGEVAATALLYAQQLELCGDDHEAALRMYEVAWSRKSSRSSSGIDDGAVGWGVGLACAMGQARCTLRLGHVRDGVKLALAQDHKPLFRECAAILAENRATLAEAAFLYERAGLPETAARLYLQIPDLTQAARLMPCVTLPKLHALFASACEEAGRYAEAVAGYERARDLDSIVRLYLSDAYPRPEQAFGLVHSTGSAAAAMMVRA